jgi:hypothetical protein
MAVPVCKIRVELNGLVKVGDRPVVITLLLVGCAAVVVECLHFRIELNRLIEVGYRVVVIALVGVGVTAGKD